MRILFLNPPAPAGCDLVRSYSGGYGDLLASADVSLIRFPPLELLRMAGIARAAGLEVFVVDQQMDTPAEWPADVDRIVTILSLPTLQHDCTISKQLRERYPQSRGYIYLSIRDEQVWRQALAASDGAVLLLPEAVPRLCEILVHDEREGTVRQDGMPRPGDRPEERALEDDEPLPARDLLDHSGYVFSPFETAGSPSSPIATAQTSFGCPYPCGYYCPYPAAEGKRIRAYSPARVAREYQQMSALPVTGVVYRDPVFTFNAQRTENICAAIVETGVRLPWWCETRIDTLTPALLGAMAKAGCVGMEVGVESGDNEVLQNQARKRLTREKVRTFQKSAADAGIVPHFLFMIGIPGETADNVAHTLEFIIDLGLPSTSFNISTITPYPGTPLYADALRAGWIEQDSTKQSGYNVSMRTDQLTSAALVQAENLGQQLHELMDRKTGENETSWAARHAQFQDKLRAWVQDASKPRA